MDITSIAGLASSLKAAGDIAKAMVDLRDASIFQAKLIDLQREIMSAQGSALTANTDQLAMLERIRDLEKKVAGFEAWDREKNRYQLTDFGSGTFAYALKSEARDGEPMHYICATCYQQGHKSILQFKHRNYLRQEV